MKERSVIHNEDDVGGVDEREWPEMKNKCCEEADAVREE